MCPIHFEEKMFWNKSHDRLRRNSVPTLHLPQPLPKSLVDKVNWVVPGGKSKQGPEVTDLTNGDFVACLHKLIVIFLDSFFQTMDTNSCCKRHSSIAASIIIQPSSP